MWVVPNILPTKTPLIVKNIQMPLSSQELFYLLGNIFSQPSWIVHSLFNINRILLCVFWQKLEERAILLFYLLAPEHLIKIFCISQKKKKEKNNLASILTQSANHKENILLQTCLLNLQGIPHIHVYFCFSIIFTHHWWEIGIWAVV